MQIDPNRLNIDPATIEPPITDSTKAICVVRHGGQAVGAESPVAQKVYLEQKIELPIHNHLTDEQVEQMIQDARRAVRHLGRCWGRAAERG